MLGALCELGADTHPNSPNPVLVVVMLIAGYILYALMLVTAPHHASIPDLMVSLYWSATTLSTVGFGDFIPVSNTSRTFTIVYMFVILFLIAFLSGQVSSSLTTASLQSSNQLNSLEQITGRLCIVSPYYSLSDWFLSLPPDSKPPNSRVFFRNPSTCVQGVLNGTFQASLTERYENVFYAKTYGSSSTAVSGIISDGVGYVWLLPADAPYRSFLNTAILEARFSASWSASRTAILNKWGLAPPASTLSSEAVPAGDMYTFVITIVVLVSFAMLHRGYVRDQITFRHVPARAKTSLG